MNHDGDERTRADRVNAFVGSPVGRVAALRFLRARGQYVDDVPAASVLHAAVLRSSVAHGRVRRIDAGRARALPGVHAVITAAEIGPEVPLIPLRQDVSPDLKRFEQPVIAHDKVRYVGEPLALVVADSAAIAEDALELSDLAIESLPAVVERDAARRGGAVLVEAVRA